MVFALYRWREKAFCEGWQRDALPMLFSPVRRKESLLKGKLRGSPLLHGSPSCGNDHTGSSPQFIPFRSALRYRGFRALRSAPKCAAFGNRKPFIKGLTENFTSLYQKAPRLSAGSLAFYLRLVLLFAVQPVDLFLLQHTVSHLAYQRLGQLLTEFDLIRHRVFRDILTAIRHQNIPVLVAGL